MERVEDGLADTTAATRTTPGVSLARRAFLPSPLEERPGPVRVDAFALLRALFILGAIVVDLGIYLGFRSSCSQPYATVNGTGRAAVYFLVSIVTA